MSMLAAFVVGLVSLEVRAVDPSSKIICGTNEENEIWCTNVHEMEQGKWERLPGELKQVIVRGGRLWGVNKNNEIYYAADIRNPHWVRLAGEAKEISEGGGVLCGVNLKDEVFCAEKGIDSPRPEWHIAPHHASLKFISVN
jgi:hypothetical protein